MNIISTHAADDNGVIANRTAADLHSRWLEQRQKPSGVPHLSGRQHHQRRSVHCALQMQGFRQTCTFLVHFRLDPQVQQARSGKQPVLPGKDMLRNVQEGYLLFSAAKASLQRNQRD